VRLVPVSVCPYLPVFAPADLVDPARVVRVGPVNVVRSAYSAALEYNVIMCGVGDGSAYVVEQYRALAASGDVVIGIVPARLS